MITAARPCMVWNPWQALRELSHIELWFGRLEGDQRGLWQRDAEGELIVLDERLTRRERRCVLAHELIHAERGIGHGAATAATMEREEEVVRREVARRLVPLGLLATFVAASEPSPVTLQQIADEFDVDADVARKAVDLLIA
jgi:Zn-dependent peptidase ImmA (M78 family)